MLYVPWGRLHRSPRPDPGIPSRRDQLLSGSSPGQLTRRMAFNCLASVLNSRFCWAIITRNLQQSSSLLNSIWWFWWFTWISGWFQGKVSGYFNDTRSRKHSQYVLTFPPTTFSKDNIVRFPTTEISCVIYFTFFRDRFFYLVQIKFELGGGKKLKALWCRNEN